MIKAADQPLFTLRCYPWFECGMIDDHPLEKPGLALDLRGILTPADQEAFMIEGFDSILRRMRGRYLYLCIICGEKIRSLSTMTGSHLRPRSLTVAEGYHLYLSNKEPENGNYSNNSYYEAQKVVYWGNGIRISQLFPNM